MKPLLNRQEQETLILQMWNAVTHITDPEARQQASDQAQATVERINAQLAAQDQLQAAAWDLCNALSDEDPVQAVPKAIAILQQQKDEALLKRQLDKRLHRGSYDFPVEAHLVK